MIGRTYKPDIALLLTMSGDICDRRVLARVKGKVYKVAVRPAMLYGWH